jgi:hypothetical protein
MTKVTAEAEFLFPSNNLACFMHEVSEGSLRKDEIAAMGLLAA